MNFYDFCFCQPHTMLDTTVCDEAPNLKATLAETFPHRLRRARTLLDYVPRQRMKEMIKNNVSLIKTIPGDHNHERIALYITRVISGLYTREMLIDYLQRIGEVDEERAALIADDQIAKITMQMLVDKWLKQGYKMARWEHKGAADPRKYHLRKWNGRSGRRTGMPNGLNGFIFRLDRPPVINPITMERGYPGQLINCHCSLVPIKG